MYKKATLIEFFLKEKLAKLPMKQNYSGCQESSSWCFKIELNSLWNTDGQGSRIIHPFRSRGGKK